MRLLISFVFTTCISSVVYADNLVLTAQAKDILIKGSFGFKPNTPIKISGGDKTGKPYTLEIASKLQKDDAIIFVFKLNHEGRKQDVSVITKKNFAGSVSSGPEQGPPDLTLEVTWTE